jgi:hypothetical protein
MKRLLPTGPEVAVFALLAVLCAAVASITRAADLAMALFAIPIFVVGAWMGMRRSGQWFAIGKPVEVKVEAVAEVESVDEEAAA